MGSSVNFGNLPDALGKSKESWFAGLEDKEDVELGYLRWPRGA
jgi:hypothetical protein